MAHQSRDTQQPAASSVALFVTCLADLFRPAVAWASLELLERSGYHVTVPLAQTCCGQPAYNSGDYAAVRPLAQSVVEQLEPFDYVVVPSGSCAGMLRVHYPRLLDGNWRDRASAVADKTYELTCFLAEIAPTEPAGKPATLPGKTIAYHDSCAGLRELGIREQPRKLLRELTSIEPVELARRDECCGFGGTFCARMPAVSARMADTKLADIAKSGATTVTGGDLGCLLSLAGRASRTGADLEFKHIAELLVGDSDTPGIGKAD